MCELIIFIDLFRVRNNTTSRPSSAISTYSSLGVDIQAVSEQQNDQLDQFDRVINEQSIINNIESTQNFKSQPPIYGVIERVSSQPTNSIINHNITPESNIKPETSPPIFNDDDYDDYYLHLYHYHRCYCYYNHT